MRTTPWRISIAAGLVGCFFAGAAGLRGEGLRLDAAGLRGGFSATTLNAQFFQAEAFAKWDLPWGWTFARQWRLQSGLDLSAGWIRGRADEGFVGTVGPTLTLGRAHFPLHLEGGSSPTLLSRDEFGETNFGSLFQFTTHIGLSLDLGSHAAVGYRFQHMSNASLSSHNPGLNLHSFAIIYRF